MKSSTRSIALAACLAWLLPSTTQAFYNPSTGRWLTRDPLDESSGERNLYVFVRNGPLDNYDLLGLSIAIPTCAYGCIPPPNPPNPPSKSKCEVTFFCTLSPGGAVTYIPACPVYTKCYYNCWFISDNPTGCSRLSPPNPKTGFAGTVSAEVLTVPRAGPCPPGCTITRKASRSELSQ
jgi:hypothetical protein